VHVSAEPAAWVLVAGDSLRVRVTISNDSAEPQRVVGASCPGWVEVYATEHSARVAVSDARACLLVAGTTMLPPYGQISDQLVLATTGQTGAANAIPIGQYRLRGRMALLGYGVLWSPYVAVQVVH
jgi:hypothetical protein